MISRPAGFSSLVSIGWEVQMSARVSPSRTLAHRIKIAFHSVKDFNEHDAGQWSPVFRGGWQSHRS